MTNLEIEAFMAVIRTGSITRAAQFLYTTQSALSRRIKTLEQELGYTLMKRQKGMRSIELTPEGQSFITVAEKWRLLWEEAREISRMERHLSLNLSAVDSVSTYIMPKVYEDFLLQNPEVSVSIRTLHSQEAYGCIESGVVDIAFISDDMYVSGVETVPAFRERMLFVCAADAHYPQTVHPSQMDPTRQIRFPWNPEYDQWHRCWFDSRLKPWVLLDKMSFFVEFLFRGENWAILPASAAYRLKAQTGLSVRPIQEGPPERLIYYLVADRPTGEPVKRFLECLDRRLRGMDGVASLLESSSFVKETKAEGR